MNLINNFAAEWWTWMSGMFWQVCLLILIVSAIDSLFKDQLWPQVRHALWILVLVKLVMPPTWSSPTSLVSFLKPRVETVVAEKIGVNLTVQNRAFHSEVVELSETQTTAASEPQVSSPSMVETQPLRRASLLAAVDWRVYALAVWLTGIAVFASLLLLKMSRLRKWHDEQKDKELPAWFHQLLVKTAQRFNITHLPAIVFSPHAKTPAVYGIANPVMMLPAGYFDDLSEEEAQHVLLHELAHLKRGDLMMHAVALGLQIFYWFNPLLIWVNRQLKHVREICCDLTVANVLREKTVEYRQTLLNTARELLTERLEPGLGLLGVFEDPFRLVSRLRWLEKETWETRRLMAAAAFGVGLIVITGLLPMASPASPIKTVDESQWVEKTLEEQSLIVEIKKVDGFYAVVLPQRGDPNNFGDALAQCRALMKNQGIKPTGPAFGRFWSDPKEVAAQDRVWEVGYPAKKGARVKYPLDFRVLRARQVASTQLVGIKDSEAAWYKFLDKIEETGYVPVFPTADEIYLGKADQPQWWTTELQIEVFDPEIGHPDLKISYETSNSIYAVALPVFGSPNLKFAESIKALDNYLERKTIEKTGRLFGQFYSAPSEVTTHELVWDLAYPVTSGAQVEPPFKILQLPAHDIARAVLPGPMEQENPWSAFVIKMILDGKIPIGSAIEIWSDDQKTSPTVEMSIPVMSLKAENESWEDWGQNIGENMAEWGKEFGKQMRRIGEDAAPRPAAEATYSDTEALRQRLADIGDEMRAAWRAGDYDRLLEYWDEDVVINNTGEPEKRGRAALLRQWKENDDAGVELLTYNTFDISVERCGDQILAIGTYGANYRVGNDPHTGHDYGKYMTLWKEKPDGSLVIAYSMTNTDIQ